MDGLGTNRLRDLPSVDAVLNSTAASVLVARFGRVESTSAIRAEIDRARTSLRNGASSRSPRADDLALLALTRLETEERSNLRPLFNLTGTVLHTNLGRAVLAEAAIEAAIAAMRDPVALEFDLSAGERGERDDHVRALLCALTGAEDATLVNNNAAAVLARAQHAGGRPRGHRIARRIDRDRRRVPHARHHGAGGRAAGRSGHDQPDPPQGLSRGARGADRSDPQGPYLQLSHPGLHRRSEARPNWPRSPTKRMCR